MYFFHMPYIRIFAIPQNIPRMGLFFNLGLGLNPISTEKRIINFSAIENLLASLFPKEMFEVPYHLYLYSYDSFCPILSNLLLPHHTPSQPSD
jgi:hypothetical protein